MKIAALVAVTVAAILGQTVGRAASGNPPPPVALCGDLPNPPCDTSHVKELLVTGNYVVGGVDLQPQSGGGGFLTGTINMTGTAAVPHYADGSPAEILSAHLYWETITSDDSQLNGVMFRGMPVTHFRETGAQQLTGSVAACYSSGGGSMATYTMRKLVADVRRYLPIQLDAYGRSTGRRLVNDSDITANLDAATGLPCSSSGAVPNSSPCALNTVTLPEAGTGNIVPQSAGASLEVVYRDPREPLRRIVTYEGIAIIPNADGATMSQTIRGILQSSTTRSAKMTHIVGSGNPNAFERVYFKGTSGGSPSSLGTIIATNPFLGTSNSSDRAWANVTYDGTMGTVDVTTLMPTSSGQALTQTPYGQFVTTSADHSSQGGYDCLSWGTIIFSTAEADVDHDGAPDVLEDGTSITTDADGRTLPDLHQGGLASSLHKDIFIQMDAMQTTADTPYGQAGDAPYSAADPTVTVPAHNHLPTPAALRLLINAYLNAPVPITPHIDVGSRAAYHAMSGYADLNPSIDDYLFTTASAKGGKLVPETRCGLLNLTTPSATDCQFTYFPGTVGWLNGLLAYSDTDAYSLFDPTREGLVHQVFYVHARGTPKSSLPCLDPGGNPTTYSNGSKTFGAGTCAGNANPDFRVPRSTSGTAQLPGGKVMVALGLWDKDNGVSTPLMIASTTFHELGHNGELWHGGDKPKWDDTAKVRTFEPNCKSDYITSMSYAFQAYGLMCYSGSNSSTSPQCAGKPSGTLVIDYSRTKYTDIDETVLSDFSISGGSALPYKDAWFAPIVPPPNPNTNPPTPGSLAYILGAPAATRYCSGASFNNPGYTYPSDWQTIGWPTDANGNPLAMGRIAGPSLSTGSNDWAGDGFIGATADQNVNLDPYPLEGLFGSGTKLQGFDDWSNLRLDQTGGGLNTRGLSLGDDVPGQGDDVPGQGDDVPGQGDDVPGQGDDFPGQGDDVPGQGDDVPGQGDDFPGQGVEHSFDKFADWGYAAPNLTAVCVIGANCPASTETTPVVPTTPLHRVWLEWGRPAGSIYRYHIWRGLASNLAGAIEIGQTAISTSSASSPTTFIDTEELPNGVDFIYFVKVELTDKTPHPFSSASNQEVITAVDDPPRLNAANNATDTYRIKQNETLVVPGTTLPLQPLLLANDTDPDSPGTPLVAVKVTNPSHGTITAFGTNGSFTYVPNSGFSGTDTFTYTANDGLWPRDGSTPLSVNATPAATVTIIVESSKQK
jgi:Big-like domain-containing protein